MGLEERKADDVIATGLETTTELVVRDEVATMEVGDGMNVLVASIVIELV